MATLISLRVLTSFFKLTRWGESGVYGFLGHLNAQDTASLLMDSIATEARQQMIFRQFEGLFPMPVRCLAILPANSSFLIITAV